MYSCPVFGYVKQHNSVVRDFLAANSLVFLEQLANLILGLNCAAVTIKYIDKIIQLSADFLQ